MSRWAQVPMLMATVGCCERFKRLPWNELPISASLVRHSLLHFYLSHMAVHHLHHLHYHRLHLLLFVHYFILNSRLGSLANPFLNRTFPFLPDWFHGLSDHLMILLCSTAGFVCISRLLVGFERTLNHFHSFITSVAFISFAL